MRALIRGPIVDSAPVFMGDLTGHGTLELSERGTKRFIVDTGFGGGIALPEDAIELLGLPLVDHGRFGLGTGETIELPVYWGKVRLAGRVFEIEVVPGDHLIGTAFLSEAGRVLSVDFDKAMVVLAG